MITPPKRRWHKVPSLDDHGPIPLTPEGHARMKARHERLVRSLPDLARETAEAAALGDRSDNAAYQAAKSALRRAQREIFTLEDRLKRVVEIKRSDGAHGHAALGSTVVVMPITSAHHASADINAPKTYHIVGPFETDPSQGRISHKSPLGAALLGRTAGETVTIHTPEGAREYRIVEIR